jgi:hypothetical protein
MTARTRNPRRVALDHLHLLKDLIEGQVAGWTVRRTVYLHQHERTNPAVFSSPTPTGRVPGDAGRGVAGVGPRDGQGRQARPGHW